LKKELEEHVFLEQREEYVVNMQVEESSKLGKTRGSIFLEGFCKLFTGNWRVVVPGTTQH